MEEQVIAIFCDVDDFCKNYEAYCTHSLLMDKNAVIPKTKMALSEIMTILIMYHLSGYRTFKWYYKNHVMKYQKQDFPTLVSYNRFVEIIKYALVHYYYTPFVPVLASVLEYLLWILRLLRYVTIIVSIHIMYSVNMRKKEKAPWVGFMALNCI